MNDYEDDVDAFEETEIPEKGYSSLNLISKKYLYDYEEAYTEGLINFAQCSRYQVTKEINMTPELFERITQKKPSGSLAEQMVMLVNAGEELFKYNPFSLLRIDQILVVKPQFSYSAGKSENPLKSESLLNFSDRYDLLLKMDREPLDPTPPAFEELASLRTKAELYLFGIRNALDLKFLPRNIRKKDLIDFYTCLFLIRQFHKSNELLPLNEAAVQSRNKNPYNKTDLILLAFEGLVPKYEVWFKEELFRIAKSLVVWCAAEDYLTIQTLLHSRTLGVESYLKYSLNQEIGEFFTGS